MKRRHEKKKKMLSSLGQLNSEILSAHYSTSMPHPRTMSNMNRRAAALKRGASMNVRIAREQKDALVEEVGVTFDAATQRHVARHTAQKNTLCVGPCVHVPRPLVEPIQKVAARLHGRHRPAAVRDLATLLRDLPAPGGVLTRDDPRLCVATGVSCAAVRFDTSGDVRSAKRMMDRVEEAHKRVRHAEEVFREACYTAEMARNAGISQVRELEVGLSGLRLNGGGNPPASTPSNLARFFATYSLGTLPPNANADMRTALDEASKRFAPRARERVVTDLWTRWTNFT